MRKRILAWTVIQLLCVFLLGYAGTANAIVDLKNANYTDTWVDVPGRTLADLSVKRTYNSRSRYDGIFGLGWCSDFETRLDITAEGNVLLVNCGGGLESLYVEKGFSPRDVEAMADRIVERARDDWKVRNAALIFLLGNVGESGWVEVRQRLISDSSLRSRYAREFGFSRQPREGAELIHDQGGVSSLKVEGGGYHLRDNGEEKRFDAKRQLIAYNDKEGRTVRLSRKDGRLQSVLNERGDRLDFTFLANGKVGAISINRVGKQERASEYGYSDNGNLISVKNVWENAYTYEYDNYRNLAQINYPDKTYKRFAYDMKRDWIIGFRNRDGCFEEYAYESTGLDHELSRVIKMCRGITIANTTFELFYTPRRNNSRTLQRVVTHSLMGVTDITFNIIHGKPVRIVRDDYEVAFEYYPNGLLRTRRDATTLREFFYARDTTVPERIVEQELPAGKSNPLTTLFSFDGSGRVIGAKRTDGLRVEYVRGKEGRITEVHFGDGRKINITGYDASGQPSEVEAPGQGTIKIKYTGTGIEALTCEKGDEVANRVYGWLENAMYLADPLGKVEELPRRSPKAKPAAAPVDVSPFLVRYSEQRGAGNYLAAHGTLLEWDAALSRAGEQKERLSVGTIALRLGTERRRGEDYSAAEPLLALVYRVYRDLGIEDMSQVLDEIAEMRTGQGRHAEAVTVRQEGFDRITKRSGSSSPDLLPWLEKLGESYRRLGQYAKAYETIERARTIARVSGKSVQIADSALAELYYEVGLFQQAMALYRKQGPAGQMGEFHFTIASLFSTMGEPQKAIDILAPHLAYAEKELGPNHQDVGRLLGHLGLYYAFTGRYEQAYTALDRANKIFEKTPRTGLLNDMGILQSRLGRHAEALALYERSLVIDSAAKERRDVDLQTTLVNMAITKSDLGRHSEAQKDLARALQSQRAAYPPGHWKIGNTQYWLAGVTRRAGDVDSATKILEESAIILEGALGTSHARLARTLRAIGEVRLERGDLDQARAYLQRSYEVALRSADPEEIWRVQHRLSQVAARHDAADMAVFLGKQSVNGLQELRRQLTGLDPELQKSFIGEREQPYRDLAGVLLSLGRHAEAQQAVSMLKEEEFSNFIQRDVKDDVRGTRATFSGKEADWMRRYEDIKRQLVTVGRRHDELKQKQKLSLSTAEQAELNSLTAGAETAHKAFTAFWDELWKETAQLDLKRRTVLSQQKKDGATASVPAVLSVSETPAQKRFQDTSAELTRLSMTRGELVEKTKRGETLSQEEDTRLTKIDMELKKAEEIYQKALVELSKTRPDKVKEIKEAEGLMNELYELGHGAVAIYTVVRKNRLHLLLITPNIQKAYSYPITEEELNRKVDAFRIVLTPDRYGILFDPLPPAQELYKIILGSVAEDLKTVAEDLKTIEAKTLMWSLDRALRYLPVAALHDGKSYLVETYRNVIFTPASSGRLKDVPNPKWKGLGFGVTWKHQGFSPLPKVEDELSGIIRTGEQASSAGVVPGRVLMNDKFNWVAMLGGLRKDYSLVHVASHFKFTPGNEKMSFLLLGDGHHLTLSDIQSEKNLFRGVDLLTLSCCETAMGDQEIESGKATGEEVESFGVIAQREGAKAVIATLWPVADDSTSLLMREFYRLREGTPGLLKVEALRKAQLSLLNGEIGKNGTRGSERGQAIYVGETEKKDQKAPQLKTYRRNPQAPYAHPFFWAPFILIGNWK